ncbi:acyltransferase family protein [Xenorhabdus bovienii]|uniref:Putative Acyltransferase MdmB n=1 Tax=Xenorhabdus bovienii str. feltiae Moldova TaxID=1398200 RepID=A0A077NX37_XENBV|nr:acyltransferase [Xenorhabdus bovienii]CDH03048.1 putative Acyltransferase MdmB [Xenorhabdus bovienii str. feltiae Moldova]
MQYQLPSLTSLRFFAALMVFFYHVSSEKIFSTDIQNEIFRKIFSNAGSMGVTFFFCLSGFILAWSQNRQEKYSIFILKRIAKIYPNHIITLVFAFILIFFNKPLLPGGENTSGLSESIFLIQSWSTNPYVFISMNGVSWTLSCELFFYLTFPFFVSIFSKLNTSTKYLLLIIFIIIIWSIPFLSYFIPKENVLPWNHKPAYSYWLVYIFPATRLFEFLCGVLVCLLFKDKKLLVINVKLSLMFVIVFYFISLNISYLYTYASINIIPCLMIILSFAHNDSKQKNTILSNRFFIFLGEISFSFYLVHRMVIMYTPDKLIYLIDIYNIPIISIIILWFSLSILLSYFLYKMIELPVVNIVRGMIKNQSKNNLRGNKSYERSNL